MRRIKAGLVISAACCSLMAGCPSGYTYASDSCGVVEIGEESLPEELIDISEKESEEGGKTSSSDTTKPTLEATLSGSVITVVARDTESGIQKITVNGTDYTTFTDDALRIQLTQSDFSTEQFVFTATDESGNVSDRYLMDNPYYNWPTGGTNVNNGNAASTGTAQGTTGGSTAGAASTTISGGSTGSGTTGSSSSTDSKTSAPLPQNAEATKPTEATGTVIDRSGAAAEAVEASGEEVKNVTQTAQEGSKSFYTIQTKSGKTFYLIVDNSESSENVYLLTEVSEQDLMNFSLSDTVTLPDAGTVQAEPEKIVTVTPIPTVGITEIPEKPEMPEKKHPLAKNILLAVLIAAVFGFAYYFKIYKPKHEEVFDDEEDEAEEYEREEDEESDDPPVVETMEEEE